LTKKFIFSRFSLSEVYNTSDDTNSRWKMNNIQLIVLCIITAAVVAVGYYFKKRTERPEPEDKSAATGVSKIVRKGPLGL
jgi:hypothetical protein